MQCFPGQTDCTEQPGKIVLATALCPIECRTLGIGIDQDYCAALLCQLSGDVCGEGCLADPAFLVQQCDDHDVLPPARRLVHSARGLLIVSFIDSKLEPKLGKAETRAAQGFATRSHS